MFPAATLPFPLKVHTQRVGESFELKKRDKNFIVIFRDF